MIRRLWAEVVSRAEQDNLKLTDIIERALRNYLKVNYEDSGTS